MEDQKDLSVETNKFSVIKEIICCIMTPAAEGITIALLHLIPISAVILIIAGIMSIFK